jgi:hypothetical protein
MRSPCCLRLSPVTKFSALKIMGLLTRNFVASPMNDDVCRRGCSALRSGVTTRLYLRDDLGIRLPSDSIAMRQVHRGWRRVFQPERRPDWPTGKRYATRENLGPPAAPKSDMATISQHGRRDAPVDMSGVSREESFATGCSRLTLPRPGLNPPNRNLGSGLIQPPSDTNRCVCLVMAQPAG